MKQTNSMIERLAVTAIMLAAATLLSIFKLVDLPYGGSVTLASLFPILILAMRYGTPWGMLSGLVYGALQLALGAKVLTYVTTPASVIAVILLDYGIAFALIGLGGITRKMKSQPIAFLLGAMIACVLRYLSHVISGATVWAGLSIPTEAALIYSFIYNATYMLPEMLILMIVSFYIASALNFRTPRLRAYHGKDAYSATRILLYIAGAIVAAAAIFDVASIFAVLQNAETGEFQFENIVAVDWKWIILASAVAIAVAVVLILVYVFTKKQKEAAE